MHRYDTVATVVLSFWNCGRPDAPRQNKTPRRQGRGWTTGKTRTSLPSCSGLSRASANHWCL